MNRRQMFGVLGMAAAVIAAPVVYAATPSRRKERYLTLPASVPVGTMFTVINTAPENWVIMGDARFIKVT